VLIGAEYSVRNDSPVSVKGDLSSEKVVDLALDFGVDDVFVWLRTQLPAIIHSRSSCKLLVPTLNLDPQPLLQPGSKLLLLDLPLLLQQLHDDSLLLLPLRLPLLPLVVANSPTITGHRRRREDSSGGAVRTVDGTDEGGSIPGVEAISVGFVGDAAVVGDREEVSGNVGDVASRGLEEDLEDDCLGVRERERGKRKGRGGIGRGTLASNSHVVLPVHVESPITISVARSEISASGGER